jgi:hypothetical protein
MKRSKETTVVDLLLDGDWTYNDARFFQQFLQSCFPGKEDEIRAALANDDAGLRIELKKAFCTDLIGFNKVETCSPIQNKLRVLVQLGEKLAFVTIVSSAIAQFDMQAVSSRKRILERFIRKHVHGSVLYLHFRMGFESISSTYSWCAKIDPFVGRQS